MCLTSVISSIRLSLNMCITRYNENISWYCKITRYHRDLFVIIIDWSEVMVCHGKGMEPCKFSNGKIPPCHGKMPKCWWVEYFLHWSSGSYWTALFSYIMGDVIYASTLTLHIVLTIHIQIWYGACQGLQHYSVLVHSSRDYCVYNTI